MNNLDKLREMTVVVADTGQLSAIKEYMPQDATTNPSLLLKVAQDPEYSHLLDEANKQSTDIDDAIDIFSVSVGVEILKIIPGRVSTEVDSRLSFDTEATLVKARKLIDLYAAAGVEGQSAY